MFESHCGNMKCRLLQQILNNTHEECASLRPGVGYLVQKTLLDVLEGWVAKSAFGYINDPYLCKVWCRNGFIFQI